MASKHSTRYLSWYKSRNKNLLWRVFRFIIRGMAFRIFYLWYRKRPRSKHSNGLYYSFLWWSWITFRSSNRRSLEANSIMLFMLRKFFNSVEQNTSLSNSWIVSNTSDMSISRRYSKLKPLYYYYSFVFYYCYSYYPIN